LDRSRPYGEDFPAGENGVFFWQDGFPFDNDGKLVESKLSKAQIDELSRPDKKQAPSGPVLSSEQIKMLESLNMLSPEQKAAFVKQQENTADNAGSDEGDGKPAKADPSEFNLEAWLRGEIEDDTRTAQQTVKARYGKWITKRADVVRFLVTDEDGPELVSVDDLAAAFKPFVAPPVEAGEQDAA